MPEEQTWDTVTGNTPPVIPAAPAVETPAAPTPEVPPAEASTLETAPQLDAEPVARESESPAVVTEPPPEVPKPEVKDEDIEEGDTPEIKALPSGSSSRQWARRQFHDAAPLRTFLDFEKPIQEFGDDLHKRSPSRYAEHVNDILTQHQDYASKQLFGVSYAEAKARLQPNAPAATPTIPSPEASVSLPTVAELAQLTDEQVAQRFVDYQTAQEAEKQRLAKELEAKFEAKIQNLQTQFEAVSGKVTTQEQTAREAQIVENQNKLYQNVWSVVEDGIRTSGLEVKPDDPPKIASLKRAAVRLLDKHNVEAAFDAQPENRKLVEYVVEATKRGEFQNAFREEDNLKVRVRAALESLKQNDEFKAIFEEIEAYANQSKGNSRAANPVPPAPGSAGGVPPPVIRTWDDAVKAA